MFNNLVESSSHAKEFKRRGSFVLFTTVTYGVLLVVMGVISVYAYDARLEQQSLEIVTLISPQDFAPEPEIRPAAQPDRPRANDTHNNESNIAMRQVAVARVDTPQAIPPDISAAPNTVPPIPRGNYTIGPRNYDPPGGGGGPGSGGNARVVTTPQRIEIEEPPPAPKPTPKPSDVVHKGVITSQALQLPKPNYPPPAKQMGIQGTVSIQVLIDESGRVISAKALNGSPFLTNEASKAAMQARFSPTILNGQPVKVSGVITYNFVLNR